MSDLSTIAHSAVEYLDHAQPMYRRYLVEAISEYSGDPCSAQLFAEQVIAKAFPSDTLTSLDNFEYENDLALIKLIILNLTEMPG